MDVFAGAGLSNVSSTDRQLIAGSFPIAMNCHYQSKRNPSNSEPFDHYYGIELDEKYHKAVSERCMKYAPLDKMTILHGNSDVLLDDVIADMRSKQYHYLAFIDYGTIKGLSWNSMEKLLDYGKGDLFITILNPYRTVGTANSGTKWAKSAYENLCNLYSEQCVTDATIDGRIYAELLIDNYYNIVKKKREHIFEINIKSDMGYSYKLLFATKKTSGDSPYTNAVATLMSRLDKITGHDVERVLDQLKRGQSTLF